MWVFNYTKYVYCKLKLPFIDILLDSTFKVNISQKTQKATKKPQQETKKESHESHFQKYYLVTNENKNWTNVHWENHNQLLI